VFYRVFDHDCALSKAKLPAVVNPNPEPRARGSGGHQQLKHRGLPAHGHAGGGGGRESKVSRASTINHLLSHLERCHNPDKRETGRKSCCNPHMHHPSIKDVTQRPANPPPLSPRPLSKQLPRKYIKMSQCHKLYWAPTHKNSTWRKKYNFERSRPLHSQQLDFSMKVTMDIHISRSLPKDSRASPHPLPPLRPRLPRTCCPGR